MPRPPGPRVPPAPSPAQLDRLATIIAPLSRVLQPKLYGVDRLEGPMLLVGNHTLYGLIDVPFLIAELWTRRRLVVRGLGEHGHYAIPVWRDLLESGGMVRGTRENVRVLMRERQNILVYPGGAGEVLKQRGERYTLKWKERIGFAALALEFGYPVVPLAAVGVENMFDVVADDRTPVLAQASRLMRRLVGMPLPPIGVGLGPLIPRPERLYFWFGDPIDPRSMSGSGEDAARALRDETRTALESGIRLLQAERQADPHRGLPRRLRREALHADAAPRDPHALFVRTALNAWNLAGAAGAAPWLARRVVLEDPPGWPGASTWLGRDAVVERLDEVTTGLGGHWAEVVGARSAGDEVLVELRLRSSGTAKSIPVATFFLLARVHAGQITRMRVFLDEASVVERRDSGS
ncbi:MAG TPA: 1-acyl-sn-glycerol-3-phosphate acyltransferase [Solirubrobacteraceae bacterium]|nr:1-acyl-sn-glycerol-3-phosphate acyltransferase [Solirubrobacteraceae bacterium]